MSDQVRDLLDQAQAAFIEADAALRNGDLAGYAEKVAEAQALIADAVDLLGVRLASPAVRRGREPP